MLPSDKSVKLQFFLASCSLLLSKELAASIYFSLPSPSKLGAMDSVILIILYDDRSSVEFIVFCVIH